MARKLVPLDEAAKQLGLSPDELNEMRQNGEIYGYRDGASWKFKPEDIEKLAEERTARGAAGVSDSGALPSDSSDDGDDMVLLSEVELGASASTSSTVIGKPGKGQAPEDSDIKLAIDAAKREKPAPAPAHHDSDVLPVDSDDDLPIQLGGGSQLDLSNPAAHSDSATHLQVGPPAGAKDSGTDLALNLSGDSSPKLVDSGSDIAISLAGDSGKNLGGPGSDITLGGDSGLSLGGPGSDLTLGESKESDVFALQDPSGSSKVRLGAENASVLDSPGSGTGSDITISPGDSGISLLDPSDSGLSLEQPLELSSADDESSFDLSSDSSGTLGDSSDFDSDAVMELKGEDDFLLTPLEEVADDESQDSGSQVIALDSDTGDFDDAAPTLLGDAGGAPASTALLEEDDMGAGLGALGAATAPGLAVGPGMVMAPAAAESPYGALAMTFLSLGTVLLALTGMMIFDVVRNIWSFDSPYPSNSFLMDQLVSLFG
ncbi:MAG TPA: helix-turn-helix domain-containing protein [Pirellulales bacterium]|nr:helix-turn-helix domain-containing protein [Pirellulales bacterium]